MQLDLAFFASVRKSLFGGTVPQSAIDTMNTLASAWTDAKATSLDQLAYVLATDFNELGSDMKSKEESFAYSAKRMLEVWPHKFKSLADAQTYVGHPEKLANHVYAGIIGNGNEASGDGYRFRGRGPSQLTGRANYSNFSQILGVDLVANPDQVMDPAIGAKVLIMGMIDGLFTGKKLSDYFTASKQDATHARAIVNGDVAANGAKIAGYWKAFRAALSAVEAEPAAPAPAQKAQPSPIMKSWQQRLIDVAAAEGKPNPLPKFGADGFGGHETQTAIVAFQASRNPPLPQTGQLDEATRMALNPPRPPVSLNPIETALIATALDAIIPPSPAKEFLMFNFGNIVHFVVSIIPGLPDDVNKIRTSIGAIVTDANNKDGIAGLRDTARFARIIADECDKAADALDPSKTVQPSNPIINK